MAIRTNKTKALKEIWFGLYENIEGYSVEGGKFIPMIKDVISVEFNISDHITVELDLSHIFDEELHGEPLSDENLTNFNCSFPYVFYTNDLNMHRDIIMKTKIMKSIKEGIEEIKKELCERLAWSVYELDNEEELIIEDINRLCYDNY